MEWGGARGGAWDVAPRCHVSNWIWSRRCWIGLFYCTVLSRCSPSVVVISLLTAKGGFVPYLPALKEGTDSPKAPAFFFVLLTDSKNSGFTVLDSAHLMQENLICVRVIASVTHRARGIPVLVQPSPLLLVQSTSNIWRWRVCWQLIQPILIKGRVLMSLCHAPVTSDPVTRNPRAQELAAQRVFFCWIRNDQILKSNLTLQVISVGEDVGLFRSDEDGGRNFCYQFACGEQPKAYVIAVTGTRRHRWRESEMEVCSTAILLNWRSPNEGAKAHFEGNKKPAWRIWGFFFCFFFF